MHILAKKLRSDARRTLSTPALQCSFLNQTALSYKGLK